MTGMMIILVIFAEKKLSVLVLGGLGESFSTKVYSAPFQLQAKQKISLEEIIQRLKRLRYEENSSRVVLPGQYHWSPPLLNVHLRDFTSPYLQQDSFQIEINFDEEGLKITDVAQGLSTHEAFLEPELIKELSGNKKVKRDPYEYEDFPIFLINAVVAVEDSRFFKHWGVDPIGIGRAVINNMSGKKGIQGGSTITQQLAKNLFLNPKRTLRRKAAEAWLAVYLELRFTKEKILTMYLNHIYMGQDGATSIAGIGAAARFYFNCDPKELNIPQAAFLAGLIQSPYKYNPWMHPQKAKKRRNFVLKRMQDSHYLSHEQYSKSADSPFRVSRATKPARINEFDYYVGEVLRQLSPIYGDEALFRYGLKIYTAVDPLYQKYAFDAVKTGPAQAALLSLDPHTGRVLACIGGRDFKKSQFNRITQARRQPGSAFKPFVYGTALEEGLTPATLLKDEKTVFLKGTPDQWSPENFNGIYLGSVSLRQALKDSINMATLDLISRIGPSKVIKFAKKLGIESPLKADLALGLGAYEVTPLELISAYAAFANGGFRVTPQFVTAVEDSEGQILELNPRVKQSVLDPSLSFLITSLLSSVIEEGTAKNLKNLGWNYPSAGKTGTTNDGKDAWFVGYTFDQLTGVWFGDDQAKPIHASGSGNAVPIWAKFMTQVYQGRPVVPFVRPEGIIKVSIDPLSQKLSQSGCPSKIDEIFLKGTEPSERCHLHSGGIRGWFKRIFN